MATLSTFTTPGLLVDLSVVPGSGVQKTYERIRVDEAVALARDALAGDVDVWAVFTHTNRFGDRFPFGIGCERHGYEAWSPSAPLSAACSDQSELLPQRIEIAKRSVEVEAAVLAIHVERDVVDLLTRLCAPDGASRVSTGGCSELSEWGAPVELAATYQADSASIGRDLALSWIAVHDGYYVGRAAGMDLGTLRERVIAAKPGARVGVTGRVMQARKHVEQERLADIARLKLLAGNDPQTYMSKLREVLREEEELFVCGKLQPHGTRSPLAGDEWLTREEVLAALATPPEVLLQALEAAAVPDDEWRGVEGTALELIDAKERGAPTVEVTVNTGKHARFIERHAPYHVRRLENGGVLLATHPYRTLWPLWSDALELLDIRRPAGV